MWFILTFFQVIHDVISLYIKICLLQLDVLSKLLHDVGFGTLWPEEVGFQRRRSLAEGHI